MRDYDSDTGYRSDQELMQFRRQQQQMFQRNNENFGEIVPVAKSRKRDGYSSDLEGYSRRTMAYHDPNVQETHSNSSQDGSQSQRSYGTNCRTPSKQSVAVRSDELYEHNSMNPSINHYPSSPSPLQSRNVTDQSTPLVPVTPCSKYCKSDVDLDYKKELLKVTSQMSGASVIDPENRYMVCLFIPFILY